MTLIELIEQVRKQNEEIAKLRIVVSELVDRVAESFREAEKAEEWLRQLHRDQRQRRAKQAETQTKKQEPVTQKIVEQIPRSQKETAHKTAELFNTNRTYVNQANKLKEQAPEVFEAVKAGTMRMTDGNKAVNAIPKDPWSSDERERQEQAQLGATVVANASRDKNLIQWAEKVGKAVRIDRSTKYGNPFVLPNDGDRDYVCDCFENHYLPNKPSILSDAVALKGKVLICHCYPERCHGNCLASMANKTKK